MKTTVDVQDDLLDQARRLAKRTGRPLRAVIEQGLRLALREAGRDQPYVLPDCSFGEPDAPDPLESLSWQDLRGEIYGSPGARG